MIQRFKSTKKNPLACENRRMQQKTDEILTLGNRGICSQRVNQGYKNSAVLRSFSRFFVIDFSLEKAVQERRSGSTTLLDPGFKSVFHRSHCQDYTNAAPATCV
ncbi:hypothetical protein AVEN_6029-1 [Araneus ventricosus]|uniref:Uncharacterized protein n=1 Tax=Araneus ventricosus TaxID=182803 RepID=A0A4Y2HRT4_ARAVE|nr:hypothetical protein AVEN_6029-1 [Araneus ventricosus]